MNHLSYDVLDIEGALRSYRFLHTSIARQTEAKYYRSWKKTCWSWQTSRNPMTIINKVLDHLFGHYSFKQRD